MRSHGGVRNVLVPVSVQREESWKRVVCVVLEQYCEEYYVECAGSGGVLGSDVEQGVVGGQRLVAVAVGLPAFSEASSRT